MKGKLLLVTGVVATTFYMCAATTNQELFLRANKLYHETKIEDALKQYDRVSNKGVAVWYNMGLCYYTLKDYARALAMFKRAQHRAPRSMMTAIMINIDQVNRLIGTDEENFFFKTLYRFVQESVAGTTLLQWQLLLLLCLYMMVFCLIKMRTRWWYVFIVSWLLPCLICMLPIIMVKWRDEYRHTAIVLPETMVVYSGPYQDCHQQGQLKSGSEVVVLKTHKAWCKIQYGTIIGWAQKESIVPTV